MRKAVYLACAIFVLSFLWVASGVFGGDDKEKSENIDSVKANIERISKVRTISVNAEMVKNHVRVSGRTVANRRVDLRAEVDGKIDEVLVDKGEKIVSGDVIARVELRDRDLRLKEAEKLLKQREIEHNAAKSLQNKGYNSRIRLAETEANLQMARSAVRQAKLDVNNLEIKAPFDGVLQERQAELGDYLKNGDIVSTIVDLDPIKARAYVSEYVVLELEKDVHSEAILKDGRRVDGVVSYIAPAAAEETRTFLVEMLIDNKDLSLKDGLTVELLIPTKEKLVHRVPTSAVTLGPKGDIGVKAVNEAQQVVFHQIEVVENLQSFMMVKGLPQHVELITTGHEFVDVGQQVQAQNTSALKQPFVGKIMAKDMPEIKPQVKQSTASTEEATKVMVEGNEVYSNESR